MRKLFPDPHTLRLPADHPCGPASPQRSNIPSRPAAATDGFRLGLLEDFKLPNEAKDAVLDDVVHVETDEQEVMDMLKVVQEFDPAGVGARDLRECLLLQIKHCKKTPEVENAIKILTHHFNEFTNKHFQKIMTRMNITEEELKAAMAKILKLNPSPGGQIDDSYTDQAQQIVPDFVLEYKDGELELYNRITIMDPNEETVILP